MKKKPIVVLLSIMLALSLLLSACSGNNKGNSNPTTTPKETTDNKANENNAAEVPAKPTEITIMLPLNVAETPPDTIKNEVEKLTNTKLNYQFFPADTYEEKLNTSLATSSLPQVVYLKNQATFLQMKEAIRDGQFWEIGPYLEEFPNLNKLKPEILNNTKVDEKLYSLYIGRPLARQGLIYRKDWADNLGLEAPKTIDDLYTMLDKFTNEDPDGNGIDDTIGLADRNDLVYGAFKTIASWFATPTGWGIKDGQLMPDFTFEEYIDSMDYMKKIRDNKLMNVDFAATSKTDQVALFTSGKAGAYIGSLQDINALDKDLVKNVPDANASVHALIQGPDGNVSTWAIPGYNNVVLFPKTAIKDETELKNILAFFDAMMTSEISNLMYWGIEGVHYTVVDGEAKESDDKELNEREVKGFKDSVIGEPETNGRFESYDVLEARILAEQFVIENEKVAIHDPTAALDSATYAEKATQLQELITDATYKYIYGSIDRNGFNAAIDDWKARGGQKMIEEFNAAYKQ